MYKEFRAAIGAAGFEQGAQSGSNKQNIKVGMELATTVIKKCHEFKIDCIVAPYEAAAQLAFFNLRGKTQLNAPHYKSNSKIFCCFWISPYQL